MRLIIAGSRGVTDYEMVRRAVSLAGFNRSNIVQIVSGGARGVDTLGEELARRNSIPVRRFPADWDGLGRRAGYVRNAEMADNADALVAVWDMQSRGTGHMIDLMRKAGKPVFIYAANPAGHPSRLD